MRHQIATIALAPVLLWQGRRVRRNVPVLPEPEGAREGVAGTGPLLRVLVVGDSAAAGVGAATQDEALSGRIVAGLRADFQVCWKLFARTGATAASTLRGLHELEREPFDVVVTSFGVNDTTGRTPLREWLRLHDELAALLRGRFGARQLLLSGLPPMHAFPALPQPLRWYLGSRARQLDRALRNWVLPHGDIEYLEFRPALDPGMMAADGFHPGPAIYSAWGAEVARRVRARWLTP
jgi:lysophospholipase L1-like esterase